MHVHIQIRNKAKMQIIIQGIKGTIKDQEGLVKIVPFAWTILLMKYLEKQYQTKVTIEN